MRKICVVVGSRANYSSIKSVMRAVQAHPDLDLQLIASASALLDRYGAVVEVMEADGFTPLARVNMLIEGGNPVTMAKSTGLGLLELPTIFDRLKPDVVVSVGDRFETMATAIAAAYMNIPLAHTMGGEVSGTIDESIRHAVTKMAHIHFPANQAAAERIIKMGEDPKYVHTVGCPRIDLVAEITAQDNGLEKSTYLAMEGVGGHIDVTRPFLLVNQHPVTSEYGQNEVQMAATLEALMALAMPTIMLWPNADAGSEEIARGMRKFREKYWHQYIRFYKNFPVEIFVGLMKRTACMVGNSSAMVREGAFIGAPSVNLGTRQSGRERGANVIDVDHDKDQIVAAVKSQLSHGPYPSQPIYGDASAGKRIADLLATMEWPSVQKRITY